MIIYFANRKMEILGHASTNLPEGYVIVDDEKQIDVDSGVASFSCSVGYDLTNRKKLEEMMNAGNYILRSNGGENEFYTILDAEGNVLSAFRPELKDTASSYTFPINGQYMHLVSEAPVVSVDDQIAAQQAELSETVTTHPDLPPEGIGIDRVMFTALDGTPIYEASCYNSEFNVTYHYGDSSSGYGFTSSQNLRPQHRIIQVY
jgi:hypothetical protein